MEDDGSKHKLNNKRHGKEILMEEEEEVSPPSDKFQHGAKRQHSADSLQSIFHRPKEAIQRHHSGPLPMRTNSGARTLFYRLQKGFDSLSSSSSGGSGDSNDGGNGPKQSHKSESTSVDFFREVQKKLAPKNNDNSDDEEMYKEFAKLKGIELSSDDEIVEQTLKKHSEKFGKPTENSPPHQKSGPLEKDGKSTTKSSTNIDEILWSEHSNSGGNLPPIFEKTVETERNLQSLKFSSKEDAQAKSRRAMENRHIALNAKPTKFRSPFSPIFRGCCSKSNAVFSPSPKNGISSVKSENSVKSSDSWNLGDFNFKIKLYDQSKIFTDFANFSDLFYSKCPNTRLILGKKNRGKNLYRLKKNWKVII